MLAEIRRIPKQKRSREKYEAILSASIIVLSREGYVATNTSNIAQEAGVAVGSLYEYFPNKESIFMAFLDTQVEDILRQIKTSVVTNKILSRKNETESPLKSWLRLVVEACHLNRNLLRVLVSEIPGILDLLSLQNLDVQLMPLAKFLNEGGNLSEEQLAKKTYILSNLLSGFLIRSFFSENSFSIDETTEELYKVISSYSAAQ